MVCKFWGPDHLQHIYLVFGRLLMRRLPDEEEPSEGLSRYLSWLIFAIIVTLLALLLMSTGSTGSKDFAHNIMRLIENA